MMLPTHHYWWTAQFVLRIENIYLSFVFLLLARKQDIPQGSQMCSIRSRHILDPAHLTQCEQSRRDSCHSELCGPTFHPPDCQPWGVFFRSTIWLFREPEVNLFGIIQTSFTEVQQFYWWRPWQFSLQKLIRRTSWHKQWLLSLKLDWATFRVPDWGTSTHERPNDQLIFQG